MQIGAWNLKNWMVLIMLSIKPIAGGQANYYLALAADDYYASDGPGYWIGTAASPFGYHGMVNAIGLRNAFDGKSHDGSRQLVPSQKNQRVATDLTLSAPKWFAILCELSPPSVAATFDKIERRAVLRTIGVVEAQYARTRTGKGGIHHHSAKLFAAVFRHRVSREQDMQTHSHIIVFRPAIRANTNYRETGAIDLRQVYKNKKIIGRLYTDALAHELEKTFGLRFERKGEVLTLVGFPEELITAFSKRRMQIVAEMKHRGVSGGKAAAVASLATRKKKIDRPLDELRAEWRQAVRQLGYEPDRLFSDVLAKQAAQLHVDPFAKLEAKLHSRLTAAAPAHSPPPVSTLTQHPATVAGVPSTAASKQQPFRRTPALPTAAPGVPPPLTRRVVPSTSTAATALDRTPNLLARHMARRALRTAAKLSSHFSVRDVLELSANDRLCRHYNLDKLLKAVCYEMQHWKPLVYLGVHQGDFRYTTKEILRTEKKLIRLVNDGQRSSWHSCRVGGVLAAPLRGRNVSAEQWAAVQEITTAPKAVAVLEGGAGTGKTTTIAEAAKIWKASAYDVRGAAISGKAAKELETATNIPADTITRTLWDAKRGRIRFHPFSLVVIDEAAMADTRQLTDLVGRVRRGGGKVVLVGDAGQLQPVISGNAFARILQSVRGGKLQTTVRQRHAWLREAVRDFANGHANKALAAFRQRGCFVTDKSRDDVVTRLVDDWRQMTKVSPNQRVILCGTKADARYINQSIQHDKRLRGELGKLSIKVGEERFHRNDRVIFTKNNRRLGLRNGDMGKVVAVIPPLQHLLVKLDNGKYKFIPTLVYRHMQLGEAITTHRAQGMTVERAQIFVGGRINRELTYVQASRARNETRFYVDPKLLPHLERNMRRSEKKTLAMDLQDRQQTSRRQKQELQR